MNKFSVYFKLRIFTVLWFLASKCPDFGSQPNRSSFHWSLTLSNLHISLTFENRISKGKSNHNSEIHFWTLTLQKIPTAPPCCPRSFPQITTSLNHVLICPLTNHPKRISKSPPHRLDFFPQSPQTTTPSNHPFSSSICLTQIPKLKFQTTLDKSCKVKRVKSVTRKTIPTKQKGGWVGEYSLKKQETIKGTTN